MALFSIITVCYNSEKTLSRTMMSVLKQECKDYEYIIVDGGSVDGTIEIIKAFESLFEGRLSWESEPDNGIYDAFNKGIRRSTGRYVWIVNSDDYLESDALKSIADVINGFKEGYNPILSCALNYIDEMSGLVIRKDYYTSEDADYFYKRDSTGVVHPATLVPKHIYEEFGSYDDRYKLLGDCDWFHRIYRDKIPIVFLNYTVTNMTNQGISSQWSYKRYLISKSDRIIYFKKFYKNPFVRKTRYFIWNIMILKNIVFHTIKTMFENLHNE